ncbi:MAG: hypothetical protein ACK4GN_17050 [Runella sp.]
MLGNQSFRGNVSIKTEALQPLLPQRPNKKLLGLPGVTPSLWIYQSLDKRYDRSKPAAALDSLNARYERQLQDIGNQPRKLSKARRKYTRLSNRYRLRVEEGNWLMRTFGEPPVYYSDKNTRNNALKIKSYLVNQGYRDAKVTYQIDTVLGRIRTTYIINEGLPYILRHINLRTQTDKDIDSLLSNHLKNSYLKSGNNYRNSDVANESVRIERLLRNNGYFGFERNYLRPVQNAIGKQFGGFLIDTTAHDSATDSLYHIVDILGLQINYPRNQTQHLRYHVGTVGFQVEGVPTTVQITGRDSLRYRGISYTFTPKHYYAPKILDSKILIRPQALYRQNDWDETYRQLSVLDQFRFINIQTDTLAGQINTLVRVIPQDRYQLTGEGGVNVVQNLPGPFLNGTFRVRNIFGGLENLEFSLRGALDAQLGLNNNQSLVRTLELGANTALIFPQILFPGKIARLLDRKTPRTIISIGYNYTNRDFLGRNPDFIRSGFQASLRYSWKKSDYEFPVFLYISR